MRGSERRMPAAWSCEGMLGQPSDSIRQHYVTNHSRGLRYTACHSDNWIRTQPKLLGRWSDWLVFRLKIKPYDRPANTSPAL